MQNSSPRESARGDGERLGSVGRHGGITSGVGVWERTLTGRFSCLWCAEQDARGSQDLTGRARPPFPPPLLSSAAAYF